MADFRDDNYMTGEQAKEFGLIDHVGRPPVPAPAQAGSNAKTSSSSNSSSSSNNSSSKKSAAAA